MKILIHSLLWVTTILPSFSQAPFFQLSNTFFQKYVDGNGQVAYAQIKKNPQMLNDLYSQVQYFDLDGIDDNSHKAFLINSYNLLVIKQVVDLMPMNSPLENKQFTR